MQIRNQVIRSYSGRLDHCTMQIATSVVNREQKCSVAQNRRSRGNVRIVDIAVNGSYIMIDNTSETPTELSGWTLKCSIQGESDVSYIFGDYVLQPGAKLKIYTCGYKPVPGDNIHCEYMVNNDISSWGAGSGTAVLFDAKMSEKASLTRTVTYQT